VLLPELAALLLLLLLPLLLPDHLKLGVLLPSEVEHAATTCHTPAVPMVRSHSQDSAYAVVQCVSALVPMHASIHSQEPPSAQPQG